MHLGAFMCVQMCMCGCVRGMCAYVYIGLHVYVCKYTYRHLYVCIVKENKSIVA